MPAQTDRKFSRRAVIFGGTAFVVASLLGTSVSAYNNESDPRRPPAEVDGRILVDWHAHPRTITNDSSIRHIENITRLLSRGISCLTESRYNDRYLSYERVMQAYLRGFFKNVVIHEIDKGIFASFTAFGNGSERRGYFARSQEVFMGDKMATPHFLAPGLEGDLITTTDPFWAIEKIRRRGSKPVLAHLPLIMEQGSIPYLATSKEELDPIKEYAIAAGTVEKFNGFAPRVDFLPNKYNVALGNKITLELMDDLVMSSGTYGSDAHYRTDHARTSGNYIPLKDRMSISDLHNALETKDLEQAVGNINSIASFSMSMCEAHFFG